MSLEYAIFLQRLVKNLPPKTLIGVLIHLVASPSLLACLPAQNELMGSSGILPKTRGKALPFHSTFFLYLFVADSTFNSATRKRQRLSMEALVVGKQKRLFFCCFSKFWSDFSFEANFQQMCYLPNWKGIFVQNTYTSWWSKYCMPPPSPPSPPYNLFTYS